MFDLVRFKNFKALRDTVLPLGRFTLLIGPNGSGKSTALQALRAVGHPGEAGFDQIVSALTRRPVSVQVQAEWVTSVGRSEAKTQWTADRMTSPQWTLAPNSSERERKDFQRAVASIRIFSFEARSMSAPVQIQPDIQLASDGSNLAGVLEDLQSTRRERFDQLNDEFGRWLPEFDQILLPTTQVGTKSIMLRTRKGKHEIKAAELSQGTLLALALLTLAYLPEPPAIVCVEEPDRGIHPRLLREVRDALYRLCYPEDFGESRAAVQVIATTHSPYMLDLYSDHPEEVVVAQKTDQEVRFQRLSDRDDLDEILRDAHLGDLWYSGIFGGVPSHT